MKKPKLKVRNDLHIKHVIMFIYLPSRRVEGKRIFVFIRIELKGCGNNQKDPTFGYSIACNETVNTIHNAIYNRLISEFIEDLPST